MATQVEQVYYTTRGVCLRCYGCFVKKSDFYNVIFLGPPL